MKVSQHSPMAMQQMKAATSYINSKIESYGKGLEVELDGQSGKNSILVKNEQGQTVKRIDGAHVANKMAKGIYVVV